jgi:hypothetical protein
MLVLAHGRTEYLRRGRSACSSSPFFVGEGLCGFVTFTSLLFARAFGSKREGRKSKNLNRNKGPLFLYFNFLKVQYIRRRGRYKNAM